MKIKRIIYGRDVEIKLSDIELWGAYREQKHRFAVEDVRAMLDDDNWDWGDDKPELTDAQINQIAADVQDWMDDNDHVMECYWDYIHNAIEEEIA